MICVSGYRNPHIRIYAGRMNMKLAAKIKAIRLNAGLNQTQFGELFDVTQSTVVRWERGAMPQAEVLQRIADYAHTTVDRLLDTKAAMDAGGDEIAVVGFVGAGAQVLPYDDYARGDGMEFIKRPDYVKGRAVAVEVKGDSMLPIAWDGWKLIYTGEQTIIESEVLNKLCVVKLVDGGVLVKVILRGSKPQRYHLQSSNAPLIEDVEIEWAARVESIVPA